MTYRWEDAPGLEHHCGVCATPLASSKAKNTCIGVHVEPCPKFHPHLHFVGQSHVCKSCRNSNEAHELRHREIAAVLYKLQAEVGDGQGGGGRGRGRGDASGGNSVGVQSHAMTTALKKKDKKAAKKMAKAATRAKVLTTKDVERIAKILHPSTAGGENDTGTTATTPEATPPENDPSGAKKRAVRDGSSFGSTPDEILTDGQDDETSTAISRKKKRPNSSTVTDLLSTPSTPLPKPLRTHATPQTANSLLFPTDLATEVDRILAAFNLPMGTQPAKHLTGAMERLRKLVKKDLEIERNELKYTRQREEGYWRWASRKMEERMMERWEVDGDGGKGVMSTTLTQAPTTTLSSEVSASGSAVDEACYSQEHEVAQEQWRRVGRAGNTTAAVTTTTTLKLSRNGASFAREVCNPALKEGRFGALYALGQDEEVDPPPSPSPSPLPAPDFPSSDYDDSPVPLSWPKIAPASSYGQLPSLEGLLGESTTDTTAVADGTGTGTQDTVPESGTGKHARRNAARKTRNKAEKLVAFHNLYALAQLPLLLPASILAPDKLPPNIWIVFTASGIVMVDICRCHKEKSGCLYTFKLVADRWGVEVYGAEEIATAAEPGKEWGEEKVRREASKVALWQWVAFEAERKIQLEFGQRQTNFYAPLTGMKH